MTTITRTAIAVVLLFALTACGGSNTRLDRFQSQCADGDLDACEQLYWDAPVDSDHEAFAASQILGTDDIDDVSVHDLALQILWNRSDADMRTLLCRSYTSLGPDEAYEVFVDGWSEMGDASPPPPFEHFDAFFGDTC